jgi:HSP20 family protein
MTPKGDDQKKQRREEGEGDAGTGHLSFTGFFRGLESLFDTVIKLEEEGRQEHRYEGESSSLSGRFKTAIGLSIKTGLLDDTISMKPVESTRTVAQAPIVETEREPFVDLFDEQDHVQIIIELPGVDEDDILIEVNGDIFILSITNSNRPYTKEVILPRDTDASTMTKKYTNGLLEIMMSKKQHG